MTMGFFSIAYTTSMAFGVVPCSSMRRHLYQSLCEEEAKFPHSAARNTGPGKRDAVADPEGFPLKPPSMIIYTYSNVIQQLWTLKKLPCLVSSLFTNCS